MSNFKKFTFTFNGVKFTLPSKFYVDVDWYTKKPIEPKIEVNRVAAGKLIKQYVKAKYPSVVCTVSSDSYSGGSSTRAHLSDKYGFSIDENIFKDIRAFAEQFQHGSFNGMIDMYEYNDTKYNTDKGMVINPSVKFVFAENRPGFDSVQEICASILETMKGGKYIDQEDRPHTLEEAWEIIKCYHTNDSRNRRAIELAKEYIESKSKKAA